MVTVLSLLEGHLFSRKCLVERTILASGSNSLKVLKWSTSGTTLRNCTGCTCTQLERHAWHDAEQRVGLIKRPKKPFMNILSLVINHNYIYIYIHAKLKTCPSVCLSHWYLTWDYRHRHINCLTSWTHHPPTSSMSPWVNVVISLHSAACWRWRSGENLSNIPLKTTAQIAQWVEQLTCIQKVAGLNPGVNSFASFFMKISSLCTCFFLIFFWKFIFDTPVTCHSKHVPKWDLSKIKCTSVRNLIILIANRYLLLFILYSTLKALV